MASIAKTNNKLTPCACRSFEFGEFDGENEAAVSYDTGCNEQTKRTFAMGHDAKLVGFLVRAEMAGEEIRMVQGGVAITFAGATDAALRISDALAAKAAAQIDAARARIAKKAAREATKKARASKKTAEKTAERPFIAPTPQPREARIKVGRWVYDATIDPNGWATYAKKFSGPVTVSPDKYTEV